MPAFCPVLGRTRAEAQAKFDQLQELVDPLAGLGSLYSTFGDLSGYPLDGPVPEDAIGKLGIRSISAQLRERVRQEKPTTLFRRPSCEKVAPSGQFEIRRSSSSVPSMTDGLSTLYQDLLSGSYDCVDRIVLNAYFRMGHSPGGFRVWWRALTGSDETLENAT